MMSVTPDHHRKAGLGVTASPSPFLTPRPERRRTDIRVSDWGLNRQDRDKEVNVQVLLRCRPLSDDEQRLNVPRVINCNEHKREVTVVQSLANKQVDRVFTFDRVFGPKAQQRTIYDQAIVPIVNEVLDGFNCTVFAYGQTGTGKTYTMEGGMRNKEGDLPVEAGVIPRAVRQIVDTLEAQNADYSMKVTFLELYNEEVTDLLAPEDNSRSTEDKQKKPISLMEDGKGCVVVRGLEEEAVYSANEIYTLLERGAAKRRTADTLLNKRSSRSHSVFSITILIKEAAIGDEDVIKCGKLNLVDLAGSENISRSGAREGRAREAGEINKSLLTLGRVINALVEHSAHIPYRDSKLTRLLRDSLGGKTKTCIIATISPTAQCLEETLSTLDYACRAKNIKNKPEANQKISKAVLLKDLYLEIEKMKEDVRSAREKNGVYIPHERFVKDEAEKKAKNEKIEQLEVDINISEKEVDKYRELYLTEQEQKLDFESKLKDCKVNLENTNKSLFELQEDHMIAISELKEKELVISKLLHSENSIIERAKDLRGDLQNASDDITSLFTKLDQKNKLESENRSLVLGFGCNLDQSLKDLHKTILGSVTQQQQQLRCMEEHVSSFLASKCDATDALELKINKMTETHTSWMASLKEISNTLQKNASSNLEQINSQLVSQTTTAENFLSTSVMEAKEVIQDIQNSLDEQKELLAFSARQQQEGLQRSLASAQLISKATMNFCNDLHHQASNFMIALEESHINKSSQLEKFENTFKEEAAREEKVAMDKIAVILETLTSKKISIVTEATRSLQESGLHEKKTLQQEISNMQQISDDAKKDLSEYVQNVESNFLEDTLSAAETRTMVEYCLGESNMSVQYSRQQLEGMQISMNNLNMRNLSEIQTNVQKNISTYHTAHEKFLSVSSAEEAEFDAGVSHIQAAAKDSLMHDHQSKKEIDSMTSSCLDQLKLVQENHSESISNIRSQAEKCLAKDYLVDQHPNSPKKRSITVPSLASIEEMRTRDIENLKECIISENNKTKSDNQESKIYQQKGTAAPDRSPFTCVN